LPTRADSRNARGFSHTLFTVTLSSRCHCEKKIEKKSTLENNNKKTSTATIKQSRPNANGHPTGYGTCPPHCAPLITRSSPRIPSIACGECCVVGLDDDRRPFPFLAWTLPSLFAPPSGHCSLLTTSLHCNNPVAHHPPATAETCFLNFRHLPLHQRGTNFKLLSRPLSLLVNLRKVSNQEKLRNLWIAITRIVPPVRCQLPLERTRAKPIKRRSR